MDCGVGQDVLQLFSNVRKELEILASILVSSIIPNISLSINSISLDAHLFSNIPLALALPCTKLLQNIYALQQGHCL